jgi:hypothetical protein
MTLVAAAAVQETMAAVGGAGAGVSASLPPPTTSPDVPAAEQLSARALSAMGELNSSSSFQGKAQLLQQVEQEPAGSAAAATDPPEHVPPQQEGEVVQQQEGGKEQAQETGQAPVKDRVWPRPRPTVEDDIAGGWLCCC